MAERVDTHIQDSLVPVVLIVDDDVDTCTILHDWLGIHGYHCHVACDGEAALALARAHPLDVVVLDVILPDCSGLDLLVQLKALQPAAEVVMLTVLDLPEPAAEAMCAGAFDYLHKPMHVQEIVEVVDRAWAVRQARI